MKTLYKKILFIYLIFLTFIVNAIALDLLIPPKKPLLSKEVKEKKNIIQCYNSQKETSI